MFDKKFEAELPMFDAKLGNTASRGAESWQFLAFIFAAVVTLLLSITDEVVMPHSWKIILKAIIFLLCFYVFMVNVPTRNMLIGFLTWIKTEKHL